MPSYDNRAEQQVLSAMLQDPKVCRRLALSIGPADFGDQKHKRYLRALQRLARKGQEPTIEAIELHVPQGKFDRRDLRYLQKIHDAFPLRKLQRNLDALVSQMRWHAAKHRLATEFLPDMAEMLEDPDTGVADAVAILGTAQTYARRCAQDGAGKAIDRYGQSLEARMDVPLITTGWSLLDEWYVGGLRPCVQMVAGRTSAGKTAYVAGMIEQSADPELDRPTRWITFGLEDGEDVYADRVMSIRSRIPIRTIVGGWGSLSDDERRRARACIDPYLDAGTLQPRGEPEWPTVKSQWDANGARIDTIEAEVADTDADVVVLDLYKMVLVRTGPQEHDYAMRRFARMAVQYQKHILLVHQINRNPLKPGRDDKRPRLDDLEGGGALEQLSGVVTLLYRPDLYRRTEPRVEAHLAKQKIGPAGVVFQFEADLPCARYYDPSLLKSGQWESSNDSDEDSGAIDEF